MIIIDKPLLKFLLAGRIITVELDRQPARPFKKTRTYAVALSGKRSSTCRVHVLETDGLKVRIQHAPGAEDTPRMLQRTIGYTTIGDPLDAGECPQDLDRYASENRLRHDAARRAARNDVPLTDRLRDLERRADAGDQQARRHLHVIRQRVEAAEKRASSEAA